MDVYNSMAGVAGSTVASNIFSKVNPLDAVAAECFHTFRDGVEASQEKTISMKFRLHLL